MGGAQRIHLDILQAVSNEEKQIYFTRKSEDDAFKENFYTQPLTACRDIHFWCDNLLLRVFTIHFLAFYLNRHDHLVLFSSNSTFFYDLLPWIKNKTFRKIELLHNFTFGKNGMEYFGLMNHQYLENRIVYDVFTLQNIKDQYLEYNVPSQYLNRILYIEPGVEVPEPAEKDFTSTLKILYAGRGGSQKRIHLLNSIAEKCYEKKWDIEFHFAGSMINELSNKTKEKSVIHGTISSAAAMYELYNQVHIIIMTSGYEGFPMLIKESMACGCVPIVTALKGNKAHLTNMENTLLIESIEDEKKVIEEGLKCIEVLLENRQIAKQLSANAYMYAKQHFNKEKFMESYRQLLLSQK